MKGGRRQGAGRKKGFAAKSAEEARKLFAELLMEDVEPIARALIAKAKQGDVSAAKELFDRSWGKPRQETEIIGPKLMPMPILDIYAIDDEPISALATQTS